MTGGAGVVRAVRRIAVVSDSRAFASAGNKRREATDPALFANVLAACLVAPDASVPDVVLVTRAAGTMQWATLELATTMSSRTAVASADVVVVHAGLVDAMPWLGGKQVQPRLRQLRNERIAKRLLRAHITLLRGWNAVTRGLVPNAGDREHARRVGRLLALVRKLNPSGLVVVTGPGHLGPVRGREFGLMFTDAARPRMAARLERRVDAHRRAAEQVGAVFVDLADLEAAELHGTDGIHYGDELHRAIGERLAGVVQDNLGLS